MTTQSEETMECKLCKRKYPNHCKRHRTPSVIITKIRMYTQKDVDYLLLSQHEKDLQEFEKIIEDLLIRYKQGKRKMHSETHKLRNRFPEKAERISEKVSKRSIQIDAGIKAFEKVRIALATLKEKV